MSNTIWYKVLKEIEYMRLIKDRRKVGADSFDSRAYEIDPVVVTETGLYEELERRNGCYIVAVKPDTKKEDMVTITKGKREVRYFYIKDFNKDAMYLYGDKTGSILRSKFGPIPKKYLRKMIMKAIKDNNVRLFTQLGMYYTEDYPKQKLDISATLLHVVKMDYVVVLDKVLSMGSRFKDPWIYEESVKYAVKSGNKEMVKRLVSLGTEFFNESENILIYLSEQEPDLIHLFVENPKIRISTDFLLFILRHKKLPRGLKLMALERSGSKIDYMYVMMTLVSAHDILTADYVFNQYLPLCSDLLMTAVTYGTSEVVEWVAGKYDTLEDWNNNAIKYALKINNVDILSYLFNLATTDIKMYETYKNLLLEYVKYEDFVAVIRMHEAGFALKSFAEVIYMLRASINNKCGMQHTAGYRQILESDRICKYLIKFYDMTTMIEYVYRMLLPTGKAINKEWTDVGCTLLRQYLRNEDVESAKRCVDQYGITTREVRKWIPDIMEHAIRLNNIYVVKFLYDMNFLKDINTTVYSEMALDLDRARIGEMIVNHADLRIVEE